jgi:tetratricopeptide (TPR) repeat protein
VTETVLPEAYADYLLGRKLFQERTHLWHEDAPKLFRKAIELDPDFAPAHAYLAISQSLWEPQGEKLEEVEAATDRALELAPDLAETLFAKALLVKWRDKDGQASIALLRQAIECDLALSTASNYLSLELMRIGHLAEAKDLRADALSRDPLNPVLIINVAWDYLRRGELAKGEQLMLRMTQLPERPQVFHMNMLEMYAALGRWDEYIRWSKDQVRKAVQLDWKPERREWIRDALFSVLESHATVYVDIGLREYGLRLLSRLAEQHPSDAGRRGTQASLCLAQGDFNCAINLLEERRKAGSDDDSAWLTPLIGMVYFRTEDYEKAIENLEPAFGEGDLADRLESADDFGFLHYLVFAYGALGRDDIARRLANEAGSTLDARIEAMGPGLEATQKEIALNRWLRGDTEGAVEAFRKSVDAGWLHLYDAREDPLWREFFQIADFGDELRAVEAELERQRAVVEAADTKDDFGDVVDAFLARHSE